MRFGVFIFTVFVFSILLFGCSNKSEYERKVQEGLNSEKEVNEIFLGYEFGMSREEFLESSWEMNQQQIISGGVNIVYLLEDLKSTVSLEFYPQFQNGVISKMPVSASYISWSPWNEQYNADELLKDLKVYYEEFYSTTFSQVDVPGIETTPWISIEGNREIRMYKKSVNTVQIDFIDISKAYRN
ncbi:hypothetical protein [Rhodohalobacter sp. 8-1]|uniref:hypothetical protein n=1 Tax=Rhodohalobacter sp. 8-1 TaxID=3131972 RepID=UPI0030EE906F